MRPIANSIILVAVLSTHAQATDFCAMTDQIIRGGILQKVNAPGGKLPHVWTGPLWAIMSYDQKASAVGMASACWYGRVSRSDLTIIRDGNTGKRIGTYHQPDKLDLD